MSNLDKLILVLKSDEAGNVIAETDGMLAQRSQERIEDASRKVSELEADWEQVLDGNADFVRDIGHARERLLDISRKEIPNPGTDDLRFQMSTLFMIECWEYLTGDPSRSERLHLVTGTEAPDGLRTLSRMEQLKLSDQSPAYVRADRDDTHLRLVNLTETHGHPVLAMFHSHMSRGPRSTSPSETDLSNQRRFEKLGCEAIGGIFSLDGYARFFSTMKPFELLVFGKGAECISDNPMEKVIKLPVAERV